jgi:hypothetical protein
MDHCKLLYQMIEGYKVPLIEGYKVPLIEGYKVPLF